MTQTTTGWIIFISALGMMFGMISVDIASLSSWSQATTPTFVGSTMGHLAAVIAAFAGGKIIPSTPRATDSPLVLPTDPIPSTLNSRKP